MQVGPVLEWPSLCLEHTLMLGSLMATLPMLGENSESMISFNTTLSSMTDPSQSQLYPPSNETGNQTTSMHNLPKWSIPLSKMTSLPLLLAQPAPKATYKGWKTVVSLMVCVLTVDEPVLRQRKEEKARGREGTLWIGNWVVVAPPENGGAGAGACHAVGRTRVEGGTGAGDNVAEVTCAVKLWEACARDWGDGKVKRGDVILLESESAPITNTPSRHIASATQQRHFVHL